jgi:hypothetical protein
MMKKILKNAFLLNFQKSMFSKIVPLKLSDLGEGTKEATIKKWFKKEGEIINEVKGKFYIGREYCRSLNR